MDPFTPSEFVALVSHEMRSPLTAIKGYVNLILSGDAGPVNAEQQEYLRIAHTNVERLITLINDLLDLSQVEAGRVKLALAPVALAPCLEEINRSFQQQLEAKSQHVHVELPKPAPLVLVDRDRFIQILWNLLSNAHKYSPAGTCIRITAETLQASSRTGTASTLIDNAAPLLALSVQDEGIGIAPEDQARLFTKFFRADHPPGRAAGGTGLGLTIVKRFVELHGGQVWVASPPDAAAQQGTRITFTVPLAIEQPDRQLAAGESGESNLN